MPSGSGGFAAGSFFLLRNGIVDMIDSSLDANGPRVHVSEAVLMGYLAHRAASLRRFFSTRMAPGHMRIVSPDDLVQEVWISAFHSLPGTTLVGRNALDRWVNRVASRRLAASIRMARQLKRGGVRQLVEGQSASHSHEALYYQLAKDTRTPSRIASARDAEKALRLALAQLNDRYRNAIELFHIKDLCMAEVADSMDLTLGATKSLLARARKELRKRLGAASKYFSASRDAPVEDSADERRRHG